MIINIQSVYVHINQNQIDNFIQTIQFIYANIVHNDFENQKKQYGMELLNEIRRKNNQPYVTQTEEYYKKKYCDLFA